MTIEDRTLGDVFISRCEDKNTLQNKGDLYIGTGATIEGLSGSAYDTQTLNAPTENGQILTKDDSENGKGVKYQNIIEAINNTPNVKIENVKNADKITNADIKNLDMGDNNIISFQIGNGVKYEKPITLNPTAEFATVSKYLDTSGGTSVVYIPSNSSNSSFLPCRNIVVDIGSSNNKFRDAYFSGEVTSGTFNATSDKRLKENIEVYNCDKSLLNLPIYTFNFKSDEGKVEHVGCLAQELQEICPEIVHEDEDEYLSIEETKLVYLLIQEVKKLKERILKLKTKKQLNKM